MNPWRPPTLDPNLTMIALQALARPEGGWAQVEDILRARADRRRVRRAILSGICLAAAVGGLSLVMHWLGWR